MMPQAIPSPKENAENVRSNLAIPSCPDEARRVQQEIESALKVLEFSEQDIFGIKLAVEEALVNAIKHGNQMDKSKKVQISYHVCAKVFDISIADEGSGFDVNDIPDPTAPENLERCCGRGLLLMRHYMSEVEYSQEGKTVRMCKVRKEPSKNGKAT